MSDTNMDTIYSEKIEEPVGAVAGYIKPLLANGKSVLWMLSGGSAIIVAVLARRELESVISTGKLHVALIDERYGNVGNQNSNWQHLTDTGFDFNSVITHPILIDDSLDSGQTTEKYNATLTELMQSSDSIVGLFGIGTDGHTAGLLPGSPILNSKSLVDNYQADDFSRISITPIMFPNFDYALAYAVGDAKQDALEKLMTGDNPEATPALYLKQTKRLSVYTDIKGVAL